MSLTTVARADMRLVHPVRILAAVLLLCFYAASATLKDTADQYFVNLGTSFSTIAAGKAVRSAKTPVTTAYFVSTLKRHPTMYSLLRVNAKGMLINETIRGKTPQKVRRSVATQKWFKDLAKSKEDYTGMIEDEGRFYLFWAKPITYTTKAKKEALSFAVAAKIDLWDCFEALSNKSTTPFHVNVGSKTLYEDDWSDTIKYTEEALTIQGADNVTIRFPVVDTPVVKPDTVKTVDSTLIKAQQDSIAKAKPIISEQGIKGLINKYYIGIAIGIVVLALIVGIWFYTWFSQWLIKRRIDAEENYKFK